MKISLKELLEGLKDSIDIQVQMPFPKFEFYNEEIIFTEPVLFEGQAYRSEREFFIKGTIEGLALLSCHRCLKSFYKKIVYSIHEQLIILDTLENAEDDLYSVRDYMLNIGDIIENNLVLAFPMKVVCDEDCKGLCLICGENLNENVCTCDNHEIDPRLMKLKDFLQQD
ncbi:MAG: DUF177 domain-containing protein [Thermotaleaceae bacterium]